MAKTNMRTGFIVFILLLSNGTLSRGDGPSSENGKQKTTDTSVKAILREASELALAQDKEQHYWTKRVLLEIGELQRQAGDFEGALKSIRDCKSDFLKDYRAYLDVAKSIARAGNRERAFEVLLLIENSPWWPVDALGDVVELQWIEHLIASKDLGGAEKAIGQLKFNYCRPDALKDLAVAYAEAKNTARASELFTRAVDAAGNLRDEPDCAEALQKIAEAQATMGMEKAAKTTIRRLVETASVIKEPIAKVSALRQAAVVAANAHDDENAHRLFDQAIEAQKVIGGGSRREAIKKIAQAQAGVGYVEDALKTALVIKHDNKDFTRDGDREAALYSIAVAQIRANNVEGALRTALSVKYFIQYQDDALHVIVDHQIAKMQLKAALATAQNIKNPSRKAAAILKVATAQAKLGDCKKAAYIAERIELTEPEDLPAIFGKEKFDYKLPRTWGFRYDDHSFFSMGSHLMSTERAVEVASAAMALSLALGQKQDESYAMAFNEVRTEEIVQALARTHATCGNSSDALAWAKQIGSGGKIDSDEKRREVERRIHALIGVAEGKLDLLKKPLF
jgi:tetratricopeptide (TPR) repeat protein